MLASSRFARPLSLFALSGWLALGCADDAPEAAADAGGDAALDSSSGSGADVADAQGADADATSSTDVGADGTESDAGLADAGEDAPADTGEDASADASTEDAAMDVIDAIRFEVVEIRSLDAAEAHDPAAGFEVEFELPVDGETNRGSLTSGPCTGVISLVDTATERCLGVWTANADERTLRLTPRQPLPRGAALELRVSDRVEGAGGERALPASEPFTVRTYNIPPTSRTIVVDGTFDFVDDERIGGGDVDVYAAWDTRSLYLGVQGADLLGTNQAVYVALGARHGTDSLGSAQVPAERWFEGSTTFLPFHASHLFFAKTVDDTIETYRRAHDGTAWSARSDGADAMRVAHGDRYTEIAIDRDAFGPSEVVDVLVYVKDLGSDCAGTCDPGWGWLYDASDDLLVPGPGDRILSQFWRGDLLHPDGTRAGAAMSRFGREDTRLEIYQLLVRTFGNTNTTQAPNGTLEQNGTGTFEHLNADAAAALAEMGMTHVWFTGALQQATSTDYSAIGEPADDPDILKGRAGSPYAIRDYFDVSPDYASDPAARLDAFRASIAAMHAEGLKVLIDFVPNHVARSYASTVRPELSFGIDDQTDVFFTRDNHFFYLQSGTPPIEMPGFERDGATAISPTCQVLSEAGGAYQCDGLYEWSSGAETAFGRVTGNNVASWFPDIGSWYETVKLNYGLDYTTGAFEHPTTGWQDAPIPRTWWVMDEVITHWQALGVDGFRVDMSHMVPMEFHSWLISRSRARDPNVFWMAEAYDTDPAKVTEGNVLHALLGAGYDAVYDDDTYDRLKAVFDGSGWANDIDGPLIADPIMTHHALRYAENHDEVRLASPHDWRFDGENVGRAQAQAITAMLFAIGRGPVMVYAGQETGEPAEGVEGFGGDDGRTSIFDYWSMPSFVGWVNDHAYDGGGLDDETRALRDTHLSTWQAFRDPIFGSGETYLLNAANTERPEFGRLEGELASGRYAHATLRYVDGRAALVFVWLHPTLSAEAVSVRIPADASALAGFGDEGVRAVSDDLTFEERLHVESLDLEGVSLGTVEPGGVRIVFLER